jgi:Fe2+ transport system protein B
VDPNTTNTNTTIPEPAMQAYQELLRKHPELQGHLHTCLSDGQLKEILGKIDLLQVEYNHGRELIEAFQGSLDRMFKLYERNEEDIQDLQRFKEKKTEANGNTTITMRDMKKKDDKLEERITNIESDISEMKTGIAVIKTAVTGEEKKKDRKWNTRDKIVTGVIVGVAVLLVSFFITFLWKTFTPGI